MKFTLAEDYSIVLTQEFAGQSKNQDLLTGLVEVTWNSLSKAGDNFPTTELLKEIQRMANLEEQVNGSGSNDISSGVGGAVEVAAANNDAAWGWLLCEVLPMKGLLRTYGEPSLVCFRIVSGPVTNALVELFGSNVGIQVDFLKLYHEKYPDRDKCITHLSSCGGNEDYKRSVLCLRGCESTQGSCQVSLPTVIKHPRRFKGTVTITVCVPDPILSTPAASAGPEFERMIQVHKKMLEEGTGSDVVIIPGKGSKLKAHIYMLSAFSTVFRTMFETDMKEAKTHTVEMPDISENGARALLEYLYCCEATVPKSKPGVAVEMLMAGHKYAIEEVETAMSKLILAKPSQWFDVDVAVKLFLFAKKLPEDDGNLLKMKAVEALKMNLGYLKKSPTTALQSLFEKDPKAALELCQSLCAV